MIDFGRLTDTIGGFLSGNAQQAVEATGLAEMLANAGLDPALLDGLSQDEILSLLQQYGIDPSVIDPNQLSEMLQGTGIGGGLAEAATDWLRSRGS